MAIPKAQRWLIAALLFSGVASAVTGSIDPYFLDVVMGVGVGIVLASSLNLINGFTGQFSLGHAGFMAVGAYTAAMLSTVVAPRIGWGAGALQWVFFPASLVAGGLVAALAGLAVGAPSLRLKGDYLAIVTLGFGEIIRVFMNNLDHPINITNGPKGIDMIDSITIFGWSLSKKLNIGGFEIASVTLYYYLFLSLVLLSVLISHRLEFSRIGRAWMAIREDEIAAKAMGLNTRNLKLLAFGMGATFGGVSGAMFAGFQGFVSPESFSLMESVMIVAMVVLGGLGHLPGVILGAVLLAALPEVLRYVAGPLQSMTDGRLDAAILRQLLIALAMVGVMLWRPRGLWPAPEHGQPLPPVGGVK